MEIAEAFNQTQRYIREAYWAGQGLFGFIQLFVISNGANTRYYSNGTTGIEFAFPGQMFITNISMKLSTLPKLFKSAASNPNADPVHGAARNHQKPDGAASLSDLCSTENCGACAKLRSERLYLAHYRFRQNPDFI
ncbi:type I restriction endonuclease [Acinetobacter baumannii]